MAEYYKSDNKQRHIEFHIVGNGSQIPYLKRLTEKSNLNDYVFFMEHCMENN